VPFADALTASGWREPTARALPFWLPDSRFIRIFRGSKAQEDHAAGGPVLTVTDAEPNGRGGT